MFDTLTQDLQENILRFIPNHYITLFRLMCKTTRNMSNGRFIVFIQLPVYRRKNIYNPETNYKHWLSNQLNIPVNHEIIRFLNWRNSPYKLPHNHIHTSNDKWFNYIINNMRITKFHLINEPDTTLSTCDTKPIFKRKDTPFNNYKKWKKSQLRLEHSYPIPKVLLSVYKLEDGFNTKIYNESLP